MIDLLALLKEMEANKSNIPGTCRNGLIEKNGVIFHVIQQTYNKASLFSSDVAVHRDTVMKSQCVTFNVLPLMNVILPTHTHDVFFTDDFDKITQIMKNTNKGTSRFIHNIKQRTNNLPIYSSLPGYVTIKNREQLFFLVKYLYDNPAYLKNQGSFVPYSCFDSWEKNYFKPYDKTIMEKIFDMKLEDILLLCKTKTKEEFSKLAKTTFGKDSEEFSNKLFKKDTSKDWFGK